MDWTVDTGIDTGAAGDFIVIDFGNPDEKTRRLYAILFINRVFFRRRLTFLAAFFR